MIDPELNPSFEAPTHPRVEDYKILRGHYRTDGSYKTDEQLKSEYVHLTDDLVYKMTDGVDVVDPITKEKVHERPDKVVWLDKSARPVAWLTKELWPVLAAEPDGTIPARPDFHFVNIDREQWVNHIDPDGSGTTDVDRVDPTIIRSLRSVFIEPKFKTEGLTPEIDNAPTELDNETVLIVDEVKASGRTLNIAEKFFKKAFPNAKIAGTHWMSGIVQVGTAQGNADVPVWYKEATAAGRGVGNRDERLSRSSTSQTQRLGGWFLSTRLSEPDSASTQLRQEISQLGENVRNQEVLVIPSYDREDDDLIERVERLNGMDFESFKQEKMELGQAPPIINQKKK